MADKPIEIFDIHIPCRTCGKLIPAGGNNHCLTCRVWMLRLKETMPRWIPVTERLPDTFGEFIVCVQNADGRRFSDYADFDPYVKKWKTGLFCGEHDKVTHWMPMPEPPKGG